MNPLRRKSLFRRILHWLKRLIRPFHRSRPTPPPLHLSTALSLSQTISGDRNQAIAYMTGGTAIANVEQLIQNFHLPPQEILSLENFWMNWFQETDPPISPALVIGGREEAQKCILDWLSGTPDALTLQGDSLEEAIAFLAAVVQTLNDEERTAVLSRAFVVDGATAWQSLITSSNPLILISRLNQPEGIGRAIQNGHHVFVPVGRMGATNAASLPRINRDSAEQSLKEMGLTDQQARNLATLARRSLSALRRKLAIAPDVQRPAWAQANAARELLAPLLVAAWQDSCEGDREALARLSGLSYESLQHILVRWAMNLIHLSGESETFG